MSIINLDKDLEFEKDLLNLLVEHGYIPEDRKDMVKKADLKVFADSAMELEVIEK